MAIIPSTPSRSLALLCSLGVAACASSSAPQAPANAASAGAAVAAPVAPAPEDGPAADVTMASDPRPAEPPPASQPTGSWLGAATASAFVNVAHAGEHFLGVWVDVPKLAERAYVPMAVTLTIDASGSMSGQKIIDARNAARAFIAKLRDGDIVSVHAFSNGAQEIVPPTSLDARSRARLNGAIGELHADGSTNISEALRLAAARLRAAPPSHPVRRVVLISDGQATTGVTDAASLGHIAEGVTQQSGSQITALGVGLDYDEHALNQIAIRTNGRLHHLEDSRELVGIVESELALLQSTVATDAFVEIVPAPGVRLAGAGGGARVEWAGNGALRLPVGALFGGLRREFLVRFVVSQPDFAGAEGSRPFASARLFFRDPTEGGLERVQEMVVRASPTRDGALAERHLRPEVQGIVALHQAQQVASAAIAHVNEGRFDEADRDLEIAETKLRKQVSAAKNKGERQRLEEVAARVAASRRDVKSAKMAPPAARPAAVRGSALRLNDAAMEASGF
jgi:Ca-activated chloride channel family protein